MNLLKRKRSKNTPKIKFTKVEESQLEEIKQKIKGGKKTYLFIKG